MNEENSLLTGAVRPALLRYALPIILSMVATQFYAVADTMIIGLRMPMRWRQCPTLPRC